MNVTKIETLFNKTTASSKIHEALLYVENTSGSFSFSSSYNRDLDTPMLMASITKSLTTACVLAMIEENKITLQNTLSDFFDDQTLNGLHIYHGHEYSFDITIEQLLFQTSGLPDFFTSALKKVKDADFSYTFEDEVAWTKAMKPRFAPDTKKKAYYADINFDLLGKIIETVLACPLQEAYSHYIFTPLNLKATYLPTSPNDFIPHTYFNTTKLERPLFIQSSFASGGAITTARELMIFLKAFYGGKLFDQKIFSQLKKERQLQMSFFPIHYTGGQMAMTASYPFGQKVKLQGHSGSTGSFAFFAPEKDMFIVGDLAQLTSSAMTIRLVMKVALAL